MASSPDCLTVIESMTAGSESSRKLAIYHLQSLLSDASFADAFLQAEGMPVLRTAVMEEQGNTLAYALGSLTRLLEKDVGWEAVGPDVIERAVQLVVNRPSINVLRNALFLLVLVVSRPTDQVKSSRPTTPNSFNSFGLGAIMPLLQMHDSFLDCLIDKLASADHVLCANALNLINALMRDSIINGVENEWPQLVIKIQELGVISAVEILMRGGALPELVGPLLEFQGLTKVLLARWRGVRVEADNLDHRAALRQLQTLSVRPNVQQSVSSHSNKSQMTGMDAERAPDKWRRLGFPSEKPAREFENAGFLGLMDLSEYVRKNSEGFQNILLEQSVMRLEQRCPVVRASLSVTMLLYEYFDVDSITNEDGGSLSPPSRFPGGSLERQVEPLLLRWERLHCASLGAFLTLWKESGALAKDYHKIEDLTRLLIGKILGNSDRKSSIEQVEREITKVSLSDVRNWQLTELEEAYSYAWGDDYVKVRESMRGEAIQFVKEQRIRCLLQGAWFPVISAMSGPTSGNLTPSNPPSPIITAWRFVKLSHDRMYLHYASHLHKLDRDPLVQELSQRIDLNRVSSVDSSVSRTVLPVDPVASVPSSPAPTGTITRLTIYGSSVSSASASEDERILLELHIDSSSLASEWLDGLLMLLNQQPITADTNKLIDILEDWTMKVRMSNLRWEDVDWQRAQTGDPKSLPPRPTDSDYWYEMGG